MKKIIILILLFNASFVFSQEVIIENGTLNTCSGTFLDTGGLANNYSNNESFIFTICPENVGQSIRVNFTAFATQGGADILTIYDGDSTAAAVIGDFSGTTAADSPGLIEATSTSGCLTFEWFSNAAASTSGWEGEISCYEPCQSIVAQLDSSSPAPDANGEIIICTGGTVDFVGSATFDQDPTGAAYTWDFGNATSATGTNVTATYTNPGIYVVDLIVSDDNPLGCTNLNSISQVVRVSPEIEFTGTQAANPTICFGESTTIEGVASIPQFDDCAPEIFDETWLEDTQSTGQAASYTSTITVDCYGPGQVITDISQITNICVVIEHSFIGDLDIYLVAPNGAQVDFLEYGDGNDPGAYFGIPDQADDGNPGTGWEYCFSPLATQSINDIAVSGTSVPEDTYAPLPTSSFDNLMGAPLNGNWTFVVTDLWAIDDGTLFSWNLNFDPSLLPPTNVIDTEGWTSDPTITNTTGNVITVEPVGSGSFVYTYNATDDVGCSYSYDVTVEVLPELNFDNPNNLFICGAGAPPYIFDLTANDATIIAPNPTPTDLVISYYNSQTDAEAEINPISGTNATSYSGIDGEQIFVRIEYQNTDCFDTESFTLNILDQPIINPVPDIELCDDLSNDGTEPFELDSQSLAILGGQNPASFDVTYYTSFADADAATNALSSPYNNISNNEPIYVRVEDNGGAGCFNVTTTPLFNLIVHPRAQALSPTTLEACDYINPGDDSEAFDLTIQTSTILGSQDPLLYTVTYHETQTEAEQGLNPITGLYSNTSNPQTIHVRVEELAQPSCYGYTTFDVLVNPLPALVSPTPLEVCDDGVPDGLTAIDLSIKDDEIRGGNPNYAISYYLTQSEAATATNPLAIPYTNISNPQTVYVRGEDINTGCYATTTLDLVVEQAPIANIPNPLEYCDPDSDGFGVFTLTDADLAITGGVSGLTVSYHETQADADNNVNVLSSPYNNIVVNTQTLYARVESATIATNCATIIPLELVVYPDPQITLDLTPLEVCDDNSDGIAQFDLTQAETEVLNGIAPTDVTVSYYATQANAESDTNAIVIPTSYTNISTPQEVWIRVTYNTTGCYKVTSLELIVNPLPVLVQPSPLDLCDVNNPGDEQEAFALEDSESEILNGQSGLSLTYYATQSDADLGQNPLTSPYTNTSNPQTIYVRAENDVTGCVSTVTLDLRINPLPSPEPNPTPIQVCDADNDGFESFDLTLRDLEIINGELDVVLSYHETQSDAESGQNALISPYDNIVANTQTVYARSENTITGCFRVVTLDLEVLPSPEVPLVIDDYVLCDDNSDGITQFDLTQMAAVILGPQLPSDYTLTYHLTASDADLGSNPIANTMSYTNASNPQSIYVRLESIVNGCVSTGMFDISVDLPPVPVQPVPLELCDDDYYGSADELVSFDLTVKDQEITGGNASWSVSYYETQLDAETDSNVIDPATAYTNTAIGTNPANPQTLYVRVTDTDTGCYGFTTLTIRVLPNPTPSQDPQDIELCDDTAVGDMQEVFDLTQNEAYIINNEADVSATYHQSMEDAEAGANAIVDPTQYTNTSDMQTIYVRVTNDNTGCYTLVTFDIVVHPLPAVTAVEDIIACEIATDGFWSFDLSTKTDEILNGQDPSVFTVTYHATQADAAASINALVLPYTNISNPQTIYINITNTITGCDIATMSFTIEVQEAAQANADMQPIVYELCDDNMETDGDTSNDSVQFDLASQNAQVLDGQDPLNYTVSYYATALEADTGDNPLPLLYENTVNPQVIYVRVDNDTTPDSICYAVAELTLVVNPLPEFDLEDEYLLCLNTNGTEVVSPPVLDTALSDLDYTFEWTDASMAVVGTGSSYTPTQGGTYTVVVTDVLTGCINTDTTLVNESEPPTVSAEVTTLAFANQHDIQVTATGSGIAAFEYSIDNGPWQTESLLTDVTAGEHVITVRDINGCGKNSVTVMVMDYPLYFTPNNDGYHDRWNIYGISSQPNAKIYIFDRYGKLLKQISPTGQGWDGMYNGAPLPSSDYWFMVEYEEPSDGSKKQFKAHFTLKR